MFRLRGNAFFQEQLGKGNMAKNDVFYFFQINCVNASIRHGRNVNLFNEGGTMHFLSDFICMFWIFRPIREFFTPSETSSLPEKGCI